MNFKLAVPSHRRAGLFERKTLAWLRRTDIPPEAVHVFVSDSEDAAAYAHLPVRVVLPPRPVRDVADKFNAIHYAWPASTRVFVVEDDVELVTGANNVRAPVCDVVAVAEAGFAAVGAGGLWGVAPHSNSFFFSGRVTQTFKLVVAHAFGFVATGDPTLAVTQLGKSDYERTCRYFVRYGAVVRLDAYGVQTNSYTQAGGIQAQFSRTRRAEVERESCTWLVRKWPHLVELNAKRTSPFAELRLKPCRDCAADLQERQRVQDKLSGLTDTTEPSWEPGWITST